MFMEKVGRYMTREVFILNPNDSLAKARNLMLTKKIGKLAIVDEKERILGVLSRSDMAFALGSSRWRKRPLDQMLVKDLMVTKVITVSSSTPLNEAAKIMLEKDLSGLPVIEKGRLVGIITTHDMTKYLADYGSDLKVKDVMDKKVVTASPFHSIHHLVELMASTPTRRVVIIDSEGRPIGIVSPSNIAFTKFDIKRKVVFRRSLGGFYEPTHRKVAYFGIAIAGDFMSPPVFIIHEEDSVTEAAGNIVHNDIGALPVLDKNHRLTGIFSKREVLKVIAS